MIFKYFLITLLLGCALSVTGCGSKDQQNELVQQGNDKQQNVNVKKEIYASLDAIMQKKNNNQQIYNTEKENLREYTLNAPTSKLIIQLPTYIKVNLTPKPTNYKELQGIVSGHGTNLPGQGEYIGIPDNETELLFWTSYASADREMVEKQTGQPFTISVDEAAYSYVGAMEKTSEVRSAFEKRTVNGVDARLVTMKYVREGVPSIQKVIIISMNDDLWQIRFICKDGGSDDVEEMKTIEDILHKINLLPS